MCVKCGSRLQADFHTALSHRVGTAFGPLYAEYQIEAPRLDFAFPEYFLGIELDSTQYHSSAGQQAWDEHREAFLRQFGWHVIRVSGRDAYHDLATTANVTVALMHQYMAGRAMERRFGEKVNIPDKLFVPASQLIHSSGVERALDRMLQKQGQGETVGPPLQSEKASAPTQASQQKRQRRPYHRTVPPTLFVVGNDGRVSELHRAIYDYLARNGEATTEQLAAALQKPEGTIRSAVGGFRWADCFGTFKRGRHLIYTIVGPFPEQATA